MPPKATLYGSGCSENDGGFRNFSTCKSVREQWRAMVEFYKAGKARSIGVSNFCVSCLRCLEQEDVFPMFNQVMYFLGMGPDRFGLVSYAKEKGMYLQAYDATGAKWYDSGSRQSPSDDILHGNLTTSIAKAHAKSPIQVGLKWLTDMSIPVMVKTRNPLHMKQNLDLFGWNFSAEEKHALDTHKHAVPPNSADFCGATSRAYV